MNTRVVHTKVWRDEWFHGLTKDGKLLWQYLLTNPNINICGIFEIPDYEIVLYTSIDTSILESVKREMYPKAKFYKGWVKVFNIDKYNSYKNSPKNLVAYEKELKLVPEEVAHFFDSPDTSIDTVSIPLEIRNQKSEIRNPKPRIKKSKKIVSVVLETEAKMILDHYNNCYGTKRTSITELVDMLPYFLEAHGIEKICLAITKASQLSPGQFGSDLDLLTFFRTRNANGPVDYIEMFANQKEQTIPTGTGKMAII